MQKKLSNINKYVQTYNKKNQFYKLANILLNLQSVVRKNLLTQKERFLKIFLLTYEIQPHINTKPTYIQFTHSKRIYTHSDKKSHALQTGIHTYVHTVLYTCLSYLYIIMHKYLPANRYESSFYELAATHAYTPSF